MKNFIKNNLMMESGKLISKRIRKEWFEKNNFFDQYKEIFKITNFLKSDSFLKQRMWHIVNDINKKVKCGNPECNNFVKFNGFKNGYGLGCSYKCVQKNPIVIDRIKKTNIKKLGVEYPLQSDIIKAKSVKTILNKYGVDNISKNKEIKNKKKNTLRRNYNVDYPLQSFKIRNKMEETVKEKFGVRNVALDTNIVLKRTASRFNMSIEEFENRKLKYGEYKNKVLNITFQQNLKSLKNYNKRGRAGIDGAHHLDHKYSICDGYNNEILPKIVGNIKNLQFIPWKENIKKSNNSSVSLKEIL